MIAGKRIRIRQCRPDESEVVGDIINDGAQAYKGVIPADRWHEPYMSPTELAGQIEQGVVFWGCEEDGKLVGVMGIQDVQDVTLIRHAYVRTAFRSRGIGGSLLAHLCSLTNRPILVGTWAAAFWAIAFYEKHDFRKVGTAEKTRLLRKYWSIPERQVETSVVLVHARSFEAIRSGREGGH